MTTTTSTRTTGKVPAQPTETYRGLPVYASGKTPGELMTVRQLEEAGRRRTPGQKPRAYLRYRTRYGGSDMIDLYHVDDTRAVRPLSPRQQAQKLARHVHSVRDRGRQPVAHAQPETLPVASRFGPYLPSVRERRPRPVGTHLPGVEPSSSTVTACPTTGVSRARRNESAVKR